HDCLQDIAPEEQSTPIMQKPIIRDLTSTVRSLLPKLRRRSMKPGIRCLMSALAVAGIAASGAAQAQLAFTEVAPWSSGNSPVAADWFELTNFGTSAVDITGFKIDDSSNSFGSSVALVGITSIAPGESVIFIEGTAANTNFVPTWFGSAAPAGLQIGRYSGSGIGLGTSGDALNLYTAAGTLVTSVVFGASPSAAPFATFDNSAGLSGVTLATLSAVGVSGAFVAFSGGEIGSPGVVPEPGTWALMLGGMALLAGAARRRG
ncbi:MAG: lamin tail domain-containing protein, partial [Rubrivivax sp.]